MDFIHNHAVRNDGIKSRGVGQGCRYGNAYTAERIGLRHASVRVRSSEEIEPHPSGRIWAGDAIAINEHEQVQTRTVLARKALYQSA